MFFTNDPWWGALHANDGILAMPIFWEGRLVAWSGIVMHDDDVGWPVPGSFVTRRRGSLRRGAAVPAIRMAEGFELRADVERAYLRNSRTPEKNALNMRARVAALRTTHRRIGEVIERYGARDLPGREGGDPRLRRARRRRRLGDVPDGSWFARGYHDHDGVSDASTRSAAGSTSADGLRVRPDRDGAQAPGPINCARPALEGAIMGVILRSSATTCRGRSAACGRSSDRGADGTLVSALSPAAVSMASIMATLSVQDVVAPRSPRCCSALSATRARRRRPGRPGSAAPPFAEPRRRRPSITVSESFGGGGGARTFADGIDSGGVFHSMASRMANVEALESRGPLLELYRREARDSGGRGRFRGGAGLEYAFTPHKLGAPTRLITRCSGVACPAGHGLAGGPRARPSAASVLRGDRRPRALRGRAPARRANPPRRRPDHRPARAKALTGSPKATS